MPKKLFALSEEDVNTLREVVRAWRAGDLGRPMPKGRQVQGRPDIVFGVVDATVTGTTGAVTTPASGTLSVYGFTSTGGTTDTGRNETVYNLSGTSATTDEWYCAVRDYKSGKFLLTNGDT